MDDGYKTCAFCGKRFDLFRHVTNPSFWGYRWGQTYFCSWKCLRAKEKAKENGQDTKGKGGPAEMARKLTLEQKKKAVQIAIDGGNPVDYLKECGSDAPDKTWWYIKNKLKDADPELYAQIPNRRKQEGKRTITEQASTLATKQTVNKAEIKAEVIEQETAAVSMQVAAEPPMKITIREASSGKFTFANLFDGAIIIENNGRNQQLTLEKADIDDLLKVIPRIREMFKE